MKGSKSKKRCMEDARVKETHQRQKHVSIGFVQVNRVYKQPFLQNLNKNLSSYGSFEDTCLFSEPCCVANGVSDECLGLCREETTLQERFVSVCDKFADVVEKCTVGSGGNS